jgi:hypothetical protein
MPDTNTNLSRIGLFKKIFQKIDSLRELGFESYLLIPGFLLLLFVSTIFFIKKIDFIQDQFWGMLIASLIVIGFGFLAFLAKLKVKMRSVEEKSELVKLKADFVQKYIETVYKNCGRNNRLPQSNTQQSSSITDTAAQTESIEIQFQNTIQRNVKDLVDKIFDEKEY